jgi:glutamine phosphoribosylpyrophosphate amidotransferase
MRSRKEFLARDDKGNIKKYDEIAKEIGANSLAYISMTGLRKAIGFDTCRGCIDFPNGYPPEMKNEVLQLFKNEGKKMRAYE